MKAKFGSIIVAGSGKIGGHVASRNRSGQYLRTKTTPSNPQTTFQSAVRSLFTFFSQAWRTLTSAQRIAWDSATANFTGTNGFGDSVTPTGKNLYLALNRNLQLVNVATISNPPTPAGTFSFTPTTLTSSVAGSTVTVAWSSGAVPSGMAVIVDATPMLSVGVGFFKNLFKNIDYLPAADVTPTNLFNSYTARYGALIVGTKIAMRLTPVNAVTGERGVATTVVTIVVA